MSCPKCKAGVLEYSGFIDNNNKFELRYDKIDTQDQDKTFFEVYICSLCDYTELKANAEKIHSLKKIRRELLLLRK